MLVPTTPRSSSGEFQAVFSPCVAVNAPPSGGPTSSPKMSVTPCRSSPTCSARRIAWTSVAMSARPVALLRALVHQVALGEDVLPDVLPRRLRLLAHPLARLEQ